ncbi:MAG: hypothetical protein KC546_15520 [Anaerolineae bacterium]|nr:hypothetical protein [Anaerolineae bacterium]MCA9895181.1 hypothetical protein [Anaerolineae bacterium]MCB9458019.1 hypothetical protein [Anaerolineaceae bacterium]
MTVTVNMPVTVSLDDRIRLLSAVLAATHYPQEAQDRGRHLAHSHARNTQKYLLNQGMNEHPAVKSLEDMLNRKVPLEALFTMMLLMPWPDLEVDSLPPFVPGNWPQQLHDFYLKSNIRGFWTENELPWQDAVTQSKLIFENVSFNEFLGQFTGDVSEKFVFMPNISYPAVEEMGLRYKDQLIAIVPPPQAWGDSPPWPYDDETQLISVYRGAVTQYARLLLHGYFRLNTEKLEEAKEKELPISDELKVVYPTWEDQFMMLYTKALVAMYLEDHVDPLEAKAYMLIERKANSIALLPGTISVLRRYLRERGNRYESFMDFLPYFPTQLRVAKRIVSL